MLCDVDAAIDGERSGANNETLRQVGILDSPCKWWTKLSDPTGTRRGISYPSMDIR